MLDDADHKGLYDNYSELIALRTGNPELFTESATFSMACNSNNWQNGRTMVSIADGKELYTVINPNVTGVRTFSVDFLQADNDAYTIMSKSYGSAPSFNAADKKVTVPANCYVVIASKGVSSAVDGIEADGETLMAYAADGKIVVDNAPGVVEIYSMDGRMVGSVTVSGSVIVVPGVYVLRCGNAVKKVMAN